MNEVNLVAEGLSAGVEIPGALSFLDRAITNEQPTLRVRIAYAELGRASMLSHLEVARALERTIRRAKLPFALSKGFSPHMRLAFGSALPVGVGSACEFADLHVSEFMDAHEMLAALQSHETPALPILGVAYVERRAEAISNAFPYSTYEVSFDRDCAEVICEVPETIAIEKKGKQKILEVADFLTGEPRLERRGDYQVLRFELHAYPSGSLRPDILVKSCVGEDAFYKILTFTRVGQHFSSQFQN